MLTLSWRGDRAVRMRLLTVVVATIALLVLSTRPASAGPTVLYVDGSNPSCSDTGAGTSSVPFCTIKKGATVAVAGQTVQVASGTYSELVTFGRSGSPGSPIVLTAAPGANVTVTGWANGFKVSGRSYVTIQGFTVTGTTSYGIYVASLSSNVTVSGNTVRDTGSHGIYLTSSSSDVTVSGNTVSGATGYGIYVNTLSNITVSGNTVSDTTSYGIHVNTSSNVTVSGNDVSGAGERVSGSTKYGIKLAATTNSLVSGNVSHDNSEAGVFLDADTNGVQVTGNQTYGNARGYARAAPGIDVRGYSNTVDRNVSHDNEDSGLQFYTGSHDNLVVDNLSYYNGDHGIDDLNSTNQRIIGNTVWWNYTAGINLEGSSTGATVENNISVDNGHNVSPCITPPVGEPDCSDEHRTRGNIRVDSGSTPGTTVDYNLVYLTTPDTLYVWGSSSYTSIQTFRNATGQESHGDYADPSWVSTGSDFHLQPGSPAIDSADSGVSGQTSTDLEGVGRVDDPGTPDTGTGPRTYDDRGAFELQP
jgi:parallel beta-helix repeat protein